MTKLFKSKGFIPKLLLFCLLAYIVFTAIRLQYLYNNSRQLFQESSKFVQTYSLGNRRDPAITYVALGDSTAVGTGAGTVENTYAYGIAEVLAKRGHCVHVYNLGVSGAR